MAVGFVPCVKEPLHVGSRVKHTLGWDDGLVIFSVVTGQLGFSNLALN